MAAEVARGYDDPQERAEIIVDAGAHRAAGRERAGARCEKKLGSRTAAP
jgi:hypothetical protein